MGGNLHFDRLSNSTPKYVSGGPFCCTNKERPKSNCLGAFKAQQKILLDAISTPYAIALLKDLFLLRKM